MTKLSYDDLLEIFESKHPQIDETTFYFEDDKEMTERYLGYIDGEDIYWVGYCDFEEGCEFKTAKEMFEAPIYDSKSIKDRWDKFHLISIGAIGVDEWLDQYQEEVLGIRSA